MKYNPKLDDLSDLDLTKRFSVTESGDLCHLYGAHQGKIIKDPVQLYGMKIPASVVIVESAFHHVGIAPCKPAVIPIVEF